MMDSSPGQQKAQDFVAGKGSVIDPSVPSWVKIIFFVHLKAVYETAFVTAIPVLTLGMTLDFRLPGPNFKSHLLGYDMGRSSVKS